jgi:hypothetical protein
VNAQDFRLARSLFPRSHSLASLFPFVSLWSLYSASFSKTWGDDSENRLRWRRDTHCHLLQLQIKTSCFSQVVHQRCPCESIVCSRREVSLVSPKISKHLWSTEWKETYKLYSHSRGAILL